MRALLDVNVLLAMFDPAHAHHMRAHAWWTREQSHGWASCPTTQNGFLRIILRPVYPSPVPLATALAILQAQTQLPGHAFWPDEISISDAAIFNQSALAGPRQITDVYLLALAVENGGRLVTFDARVPLAPVRNATNASLVVI